MTPQEKAKEMVMNFQNIKSLKDYGGMDYHIATECALIAVGEIISLLEKVSSIESNYFRSSITGDYVNAENEYKKYLQVKSEIEKL